MLVNHKLTLILVLPPPFLSLLDKPSMSISLVEEHSNYPPEKKKKCSLGGLVLQCLWMSNSPSHCLCLSPKLEIP